jgi:hypothetical protein
MTTKDNDLVIVEWSTHRRIPSQRHAVIVHRYRIMDWIVSGREFTVHEIDPELQRELGWTNRQQNDI